VIAMALSQADRFTEDLYDDLHSSESNEPVFENHPTLLRRYWPPIQEKLSRYAREIGITPKFHEWRVRVSELPTYKAFGRIWGKVFGRYTPWEKKIEFDASVFPELEHHTRYQLKKQGMPVQDAEDVGVHEGGHALQEESGALDKYLKKAWIFARAYIEGLNTKATEYMTGRKQAVYRVYQKLAERLINKYGMKKAFRGDVPAEEVSPFALQPRPALAIQYVRFRYAR